MSKSKMKPVKSQTTKKTAPDQQDKQDTGQNEDALKSREAKILEIEERLKETVLDLKQQEIELSTQRSELLARQQKLDKAETEFNNGFPKLMETRFKTERDRLKKIEIEYEDKLIQLAEKQEAITNREREVNKAERLKESSFAEERKAFEAAFYTRKKEVDEEINTLRLKRLKQLEADIESEQTLRREAFEKELIATREYLDTERKKLLDDQIQLDRDRTEIDIIRQRLETTEESFQTKVDNLEEEIKIRIDDQIQSYESRLKSSAKTRDTLLEQIRNSEEMVALYEQLKHQLGGKEPEEVILRLNTYLEQMKSLKAELLEGPSKEMVEALERKEKEVAKIRADKDAINDDNEKLRRRMQEQEKLELTIEELKAKNRSLERRAETIEADNVNLTAEFKRLKASYEREADREARIRDVHVPFFQEISPRAPQKGPDEIQWLQNIEQSCIKYGLKFPRRILYAFHTALKTAEWSPLTVLAGVSGTGKSALPGLYSHFGGFKFLSLPVQPNWDSQESFLGFFNSIDNKFDAQPVLRLLAQSQKKAVSGGDVSEHYNEVIQALGEQTGKAYIDFAIKNLESEVREQWLKDNKVNKKQINEFVNLSVQPYPGLEDVMSLVLLDEMNLAHIELYFADFLSALEQRRGRKGSDVPALEVKLGAGITPLKLPLGRNVLWAGTMNQDETTKSLSDKVLDRGIEIHFPRPQKFERRTKLEALGEPAPLLPRIVWEKWWSKESWFTEEQIKPFKLFVEQLNENLVSAGRALGHRVWQSIEYYMANYPTIKALEIMDGKKFVKFSDEVALKREMKIAFEDQLVQKIMPKLRGIETRGKSRTECLDKIRAQIVDGGYSIRDDFDAACKYGFGQFMWNSAQYLIDEQDTDKAENQNGLTDQALEEVQSDTANELPQTDQTTQQTTENIKPDQNLSEENVVDETDLPEQDQDEVLGSDEVIVDRDLF